MHSCLLRALCCPACHRELKIAEGGRESEIVDGALGCTGCGQLFAVEGGIAVLGDAELMARVCDRWPEGMLTPELYRGNIQNSREWYAHAPRFAQFVDAAAKVEGVIVDVATGPGASFSGALVPQLGEGSHFIMSDAAVNMLRGLQSAWHGETHVARVDFLAFDGHHMPFRDESLDALTSRSGFDCVNADPTRSRPPGGGRAYREGCRVLKTGGYVFTTTCIYEADSQTATYLASLGCENTSRRTLQRLWCDIGLEVVSETDLLKQRGKTDPGDGLPVSDDDGWRVVAYVLKKR